MRGMNGCGRYGFVIIHVVIIDSIYEKPHTPQQIENEDRKYCIPVKSIFGLGKLFPVCLPPHDVNVMRVEFSDGRAHDDSRIRMFIEHAQWGFGEQNF